MGLRALAAFFVWRLFNAFPCKTWKCNQKEPCAYASRLPTVLGAFFSFVLGTHNSALMSALAEKEALSKPCSFLSGCTFCMYVFIFDQ